MNYQNNTKRLIQSYEGAVAWGGADHEESLQEAVNVAFSGLNDEGRAELYARIAEAWEGYRDGMVPRKLWIGQIITNFMSGRIASATTGLTVRNNLKKEEPDAERI